VQCGNYYFAPSATELYTDYQLIADRLLAITPTANFSATPLAGLAPLAVNFFDQSVGSVLIREWNFGDMVTSTQVNPTHTYTLPGIYTVTLQAANTSGTDTLTRTNYITVESPLAANFSATPVSGTVPLMVSFTDESSGQALSRTWDFGDTFTSSQMNPTHTYTLPGTYTVTLSITNAFSSDSLTRTNFISAYTPVSADFSAMPITGIQPLTVTFTNQSTGDYTDLLWNFGDGVTATISNPTHIYTTCGSFTVTLIASELGGMALITRTNYITVYTPALADFSGTPITGVLPLTVTFTNHSTGDYARLLWNFGDDVTSTIPSPIHTYLAAGTFTVTLQVIGPGGNSFIKREKYIEVLLPKWRVYLPLLLNSF
jgi:PKD repeat protein